MTNNFLKYDEFLLEKKMEKGVKSSHLVSLEYDTETKVLEIEFHDGSVYQYQNVPKSVYQDLSQDKGILRKIGGGIVRGARRLFGKDVDEGTFGTRFWSLIRRGGYEYKKIK